MTIPGPETNEAALAELRRNVEVSPFDFETHFKLGGYLHNHDGDLKEALLHYGQALALQANHAANMLICIGQVYWMMAWKLFEVNQEEVNQERDAEFVQLANDALKYLDLAIAESAHFFRPHRDRAEVLIGLQRWEDAHHEYEWLLQEDPDNPEYLAALSVCLFKTGRMASAKRAAKRALELDPDKATLARGVLEDLEAIG